MTFFQRGLISRRLFLATLPLMLVACSNPSRRKNNLQAAMDDLTVQDEVEMTRHLLLAIRKHFPALQDADVQKYVSSLGERIVTRNNLAKNPYEYSFTVVDAPMVNAFALPAGKIFVTASLIRMTESEAELAGVLGHEIAHITTRHMSRRILALKREKENSWWYGGGGAVAGAVLGVGVTSLICGHSDSTCSTMMVVGGTALGAQGGLMLQKNKFLGDSQENEYVADQLGLQYAVVAGFHPQHVGDFYKRLHQLATKNNESHDSERRFKPSGVCRRF